jgi:hypothetical protein
MSLDLSTYLCQMIFNGNNIKMKKQNTLFLCGKVLFLDDKLFCFWMTNCLFTFFMATEQQRHHWEIGQKNYEKTIEKIMLKDAQYMT